MKGAGGVTHRAVRGDEKEDVQRLGYQYGVKYARPPSKPSVANPPTHVTQTVSQSHPRTDEFMSIENLKSYGTSLLHSSLLHLRQSPPCSFHSLGTLSFWRSEHVALDLLTAPIFHHQNTDYIRALDPFAEADEDTGETKQSQNYIHIRIQQRNGRKTLTTVQGLPKKFDQKKILKVIKKQFACNGTIVADSEMGEVIQLQGDQRKVVQEFLINTKEGLGLDSKTIKVHGF
ncbi:eukaryotic translation initiation factor eIF-1 [Colletotrichum orchidophilum]|uniref:Eukaryotic translation initiation factor eIF-1 n=1 Tax=Colletotrichum orchidophilum TaxID=1209926 RepID=A0A1G4B3A2_9PEZI|nr:eukaryotic translation initiation factor eIF-1 [Colletotrichum orchidophilum]OHE95881.1 eukaryotic translation initiation factor eIF-1 [Colletotrichum orchidophilum]